MDATVLRMLKIQALGNPPDETPEQPPADSW